MYCWVCGCVNEVCMRSRVWGRGVLGWVCIRGCGWVGEFWTISMSIVCWTQIGQKVDWVSCGKTLFNCEMDSRLNLKCSCWDLNLDPFTSEANPWTAGLCYLLVVLYCILLCQCVSVISICLYVCISVCVFVHLSVFACKPWWIVELVATWRWWDKLTKAFVR